MRGDELKWEKEKKKAGSRACLFPISPAGREKVDDAQGVDWLQDLGAYITKRRIY